MSWVHVLRRGYRPALPSPLEVGADNRRTRKSGQGPDRCRDEPYDGHNSPALWLGSLARHPWDNSQVRPRPVSCPGPASCSPTLC